MRAVSGRGRARIHANPNASVQAPECNEHGVAVFTMARLRGVAGAVLARDPAERCATMRAGLQSSEHVASMRVLTRVRGRCPPRTKG